MLLIDEHPIFRAGISHVLQASGDFEVVAETGCGAEGVELAQRCAPDFVLLEFGAKRVSGLDTLRRLKALGLGALLIIVSGSNAEDELALVLRHGADGYLLKNMPPEAFLAKLRSAVKGVVVLPDGLTQGLVRALTEDRTGPLPARVALTSREWQVLAMIAEGMCNKLIARELNISNGTVGVHVKHVLQKLNMRSRLKAAAWAHRNGITRERPWQTGKRAVSSESIAT
ncbi:MAG TPA: LuxR C-terminal-related transcriptional regulator [Nevskiales bacterium]|nr:LuxR C-terminal-related transcriptional regulator [Nevskiales bacterium]